MKNIVYKNNILDKDDQYNEIIRLDKLAKYYYKLYEEKCELYGRLYEIVDKTSKSKDPARWRNKVMRKIDKLTHYKTEQHDNI